MSIVDMEKETSTQRSKVLKSLVLALSTLSFLNSVTPPTAAAETSEAQRSSDGKWIRLFNGKDLSGWHVVLTPDKKGIDPEKIFQVEDGVIHVYRDVPQGAKVPIGYMASNEVYSFFDLQLEYRW